jgi:hypothetical protein
VLFRKDESSFGQSLFDPKHTYLLTLLGFSDQQLVQLLDHSICFRELGTGSKHPKIDACLRKAALLSLSREFSDIRKGKEILSHLFFSTQHLPNIPTPRRLNRLHSFNSGVNDRTPLKQPGPVSGSNEPAFSHGSFGHDFGIGNLVQHFSTLIDIQRELKDTFVEVRSSHQFCLAFE